MLHSSPRLSRPAISGSHDLRVKNNGTPDSVHGVSKAEDLNPNPMTVGERTQSVTKTVNHLYPIAGSIQSCT